jgi:predicted PurR-regulated permease PerM
MADLPKIRPPVPAEADDLTHKFMGAVITAVVVSGIYFGQPVLMPLALAVLLSFALSPLVAMLRRLRLGHAPSVFLSLIFAVVLIGSLGIFVGAQLAGLASELPHYQTNIAAKIESVRGTATGNNTINRLSNTLQSLGDQVLGQKDGNPRQPVSGEYHPRDDQPVPVIVRHSDLGPLEIVKSLLGPLLGPLGILAIVIVFVGFILLQKDDLRDRCVRLAGSRDLQRTTIALEEAASRLSRYLALQTAINTGFGLVIGFGLWLIGVPNAGLWGLMAMLFRFVPYVGVPVASLLPLILAIAVDPGWAKLAWTVALYGTAEFTTGQAIEPLVYGRSMGLSPVAVVVAAVFWTWLWGPMGLLLSTPLTMCFVVLGRHIDGLKFLEVMLGDQPALAIEESLYLRMLAEDPDEATDEAEEFLKHNHLAVYYDEVAARALMLAQNDVNRGLLSGARQSRIRDAMRGLITNLSERNEEMGAAANEALPPHWHGTPVLCIAGRGPLDEAAGLLLIDMLAKHGIGARVVPSDQVSVTQIDTLDTQGVQLACISYLEPGFSKNARYQVRRLRKRLPGVPVISIFWGQASDHSRFLDAVEQSECDVVTSGLKDTIDRIVTFSQMPPRDPKSHHHHHHAAPGEAPA